MGAKLAAPWAATIWVNTGNSWVSDAPGSTTGAGGQFLFVSTDGTGMLDRYNKEYYSQSNHLQTDVYVSALTGSDGFVGTQVKPLKTLEEALKRIANNGTIHVMDEITQTSTLTINKANTTFTIEGVEGTGAAIKRGDKMGTSSSEKALISVTAGDVTFKNIVIDGNKDGGGWGRALYITGNTTVVTLENTTVKNNQTQAGNFGGGTVMLNGGTTPTLNMRGTSSIEGNTSYDGGGVLVRGGTFNMEGGTIKNNTSTGYGGGIYVAPGTTSSSNSYTATAKLSGNATVEGNYVASAGAGGGGVMLWGNGKLELSGNAKIINNGAKTASGVSGGVEFYAGVAGNNSMTVSGNAKIDNNYINVSEMPSDGFETAPAGAIESNVYLGNGKTITVGGSLTGDAYIGVTSANPVPGSTKVATGATDISGSAQYFHSDNSNYAVVPGSDTETLILDIAVYRVGERYFKSLAEAKKELDSLEGGSKELHLVGKPSADEEIDLSDTGDFKDVTLVDDKTGTSFTGGKVKVSSADGKVTVTDGTATVTPKEGSKSAFGVQGQKSHDVSVGTSATVAVTTGEDGAVENATVTPEPSTDPVVIDGVTFTGATSYDVDNPLTENGTTASVPVGKKLEGTIGENKSWSVDVDANSVGKDAVTAKKNSDGTITVTIPDDTIATVTGSGDSVKAEGPITLKIDSEGNVTEIGATVPEDIKLQRDDKGKIDSNGQSGISERLMPVFLSADFKAGSIYYWRINGTGEWYTAVAENGSLQLNTGDKKLLVYGDYVEISGGQLIHEDAKTFRLLSNELLNGTFNNNTTNSANIKPRTQIYGWRTTASDQNIEVMSVSTYLSSYGQMSGYVAELNAFESASLYQEIDVSGEQEFSWSLDYGGRGGSGNQIMAMVIGPVKEDGNYKKATSGTKDMFQNIVAKLDTSKRPTSNNLQTGPFEVDYDGETYTVYMFWGTLSKSNHFSGTVDVAGKDEMVFAFTAILPASAASGNILDNVKFQKPARVYKVGDFYYETLEAAIKAAGTDGTITINDPTLMAESSQTGTLPSGVTLRDKDGNTYAADTDVKASVDNTGKVTVLGGTATVKPAEGNTDGVNFGVQGTAKNPHNVTAEGEVTVTVTEASGNVSKATVTPQKSNTPVTIDDVTYTGPASAEGGDFYNVDDPFGSAPDGTTAKVPASKASESGFGLKVDGSASGSFTVKPVTGGGDLTVTKGANGAESKVPDGTLKGTVEVTPEAGKEGKVTVNGTTYTVPASEGEGETKTKLGLVTTSDGEDVVELLGGSVEVSGKQDVYANGKDVKVAEGSGKFTVTKDETGGKAHVVIPEGTTADIGGKTFTGEATVDIDASGETSISKGTVDLPNDEDSVDVGFADGSVHVENSSGANDKKVTVKVPVSETNPNGQASVPNGGKVSIGQKDDGPATEYEATKDNTVFEFDSKGNVSLQSGGTTLADGKTVGFGSVTLGNEAGTGADDKDSITVEVDGDNAKVKVPAGETFTVTDAEGNTHTYKNNGEGELTLTVDKDGKVSVETLPSGGIELGANTPITVTGGEGVTTPNTMTAGEDGATLKPSGKDSNVSNPPLLDKGSVSLLNEGATVVVNDTTSSDTQKKLEGKNIEVSADDGKVTSKGNKGDGRDGEVKVQGGTTYYIPDGETSEMKNGTFGYPAKGVIGDNKDGPGNTLPFVLDPDKDYVNEQSEGKLFTGEATDGNSSSVVAEPGAGFTLRHKTDGATGDESKDNLTNDSYGHYAGVEGGENANLVVDHQQGEVTLKNGSVHMTKGTGDGLTSPEGDYPALYLDGIKETDGKDLKVVGDDVTVTMPGESGDGADVKVPAGKSVKIGDKTYENAGEDELTLHVDKDGNVSVKDGSVKLGEGDSVNFGDKDTTITGSDDDAGNPNVTVTVPAEDGSENAGVKVEKDGEVTIGGDKYTAGGEKGAELEVTPEGKVEFKDGSVKLPDGPDSDASVGVTASGTDGKSKHYDVSGDGVTVSKEGSNNPTATTTEGGSVTVDDGENKTTYTAPTGKTAEVELTDKGPSLKSGAVELDAGNGSDKSNESILVNGNTVEATQDGNGGSKVTVEKGSDGKTTVDIPEGGKAKVNGVEVTGKATVEIDKDGKATVKPEEGKDSVVLDGKTYRKKDGASADGTITIDKEGNVKTEPAENFVVEIEVPTSGPVHLKPGETVTFDKDGKKTTLTGGGENGGWFTVDEDGAVSVTDDQGTKKAGPYKASDDKDLKLTIDDDKAVLTDGTLKLEAGESVGFGDVILSNNDKNSNITVTAPPTDTTKTGMAEVTVPEGDTFTVTDAKGEKHTYKNNGDGNLTLWVDGEGNVTVKDIPEYGIELGANSPITVEGGPGPVNPNTMTAGSSGATLKNNSTGTSYPPLLDKGSVIFPSDKDAEVYVVDPSSPGTNKEKLLKGNNVEVFAANPMDDTPRVKAQGVGSSDGEVQVQGGTTFYIPSGEPAVMEGATFKEPAKGVVNDNKDGPDDERNPQNNHFVLDPVEREDHTDSGVYSADASEGTNSHVAVEEDAAFDIRPKIEDYVGGDSKSESNLGDSVGRYTGAGADKAANVTVDHATGEVTLNDGSINMKKGTPGGADPSVFVDGIKGESAKGAKVTGDDITVTTRKDDDGNTLGANVTVPAGKEVTIDGKTYKNDSGADMELYVDKDGEVSITKGAVTLSDDADGIPSIGVMAGEGDNETRYGVTGNDVTVDAGVTAEGGAKTNPKATVPAGKDVTVTSKNEKTGEEHVNTYENAGTGKLEIEFTEDGPVLTEGSVNLSKDEDIRVNNGTDGKSTGVKNTGDADITVNASDTDNDGKPSVTVPKGGSVELSNPDVSLAAPDNDVKVKLNGEGGFDVELEPGDSVTVNGRTYTYTGEDKGTIKVDENGNLVKDPDDGKSFEEEVRLPAKNLKVPAGETLTYKNSKGEDVTITGLEPDGGTVDLDASGNVTGKSGKVRVKGDVKTGKAKDADDDTAVTQVGDVEIQIKDDNGKAVEGAKVTVTVTKPDGTVEKMESTTGADGKVTFDNVPYGTYKVDVEKEAEGDSTTTYKSTDSLTVDAPEVKGDVGTFTLYGFTVNTKVESNLNENGASAPAVSDLDSLVTAEDKAAAQDQESNITIEVTLNANKFDETDPTREDAVEILSSLEEKAREEFGVTDLGAITDKIEVTVEKTVITGGERGEPEIQTTTPSLLKLTFAISDAMKERLEETNATMDNIFVLRQHGEPTSVQPMRKVSPSVGKTADFECYYVEEINDVVYIVICAKNFSVYAFALADSPVLVNDPAPNGGGYFPGIGGLTVPKTSHGTVTVNPKNPRPGATVTVTPKPAYGYELGELTVTDNFGHSVTVTDNGDGTYSFKMPAFGAVVNASFRVCPSLQFPDIDRGSWYHAFTDYVISHDLMHGMDTGLFEPEGQVTRAQFVMTLWNMEKNPKADYDLKFPDVKEGQWFTEAIRWAASQEIIFGYDNGNFGPNDPVTRDQMVAMLYRYEQKRGGGYVGEGYELNFTDNNKIGDWCRDAVAWSVKSGIIVGKDGAFDPYGTARRNELAVVLTQYANFKAK